MRPAPRWWRDAAGLASVASALFVVVLWLRGRNLQLLTTSRSDLLISTGRLTGLVAADLLLIQVLLMARVPWIERSYGQDELARRHRLVGFWSFNLLLGHIALITVGYALADRTNPLHEAWSLITTYGGMLLALVGFACLTLVTVTSVRLARKALRYESWHLLHVYAYVGVGASVPHEIWTGADFRTSPAARAFWWSAYLLAAGAVLVFRVGVPVWRTMRSGLTVTSVVRESEDVITVHMGGRGLHRLRVQAGQFFIWRFLDGPGWSRGNPYSLSAAPRPGRLQITAKEAGDGSGRLAQLRPGTKVLIEGPYGRLTGERRTCERVVMIACGIGITPLRALLEDLRYKRKFATLVYRARSEPDLIFRTELEALAKQRSITVHYLIGPRVHGRASWLPQSHARWREHEALLRLIPHFVSSDVYVCGPTRWMDAVCRAALDAGLPEQQLHQERFTW